MFQFINISMFVFLLIFFLWSVMHIFNSFIHKNEFMLRWFYQRPLKHLWEKLPEWLPEKKSKIKSQEEKIAKIFHISKSFPVKAWQKKDLVAQSINPHSRPCILLLSAMGLLSFGQITGEWKKGEEETFWYDTFISWN